MPTSSNTDSQWKKWGTQDPYFGVVTHPEFLQANLTEASLADFFATGRDHVDHVMTTIRESILPTFAPTRVLDYGCGVGRLLVPFAGCSCGVVGVDVSPEMLREARVNCERFGITSYRLLRVEEMDTLEPAAFDLVHSFIVFQHIPVAAGEAILRKLVALLADGGVGALHFTFRDHRPLLRRGLSALRSRVGIVNGALNLISSKPWSTPTMQMNNYSMNRIFNILIGANCSKVRIEFSNHGLHLGALVYFQRDGKQLL